MPINWVLERWRNMSAPALFITSFALLIAIGTAGLLLLPGLYVADGLSIVDALFTATSAVCVTGLVVVDTATYFTFWGQLWLLILIQLGGLGLITMTSIIIVILGHRLSLRTEMIAVPTLEERHGRDLWRLTLLIVLFTLALEAVTAAVLWVQWISEFGATMAAWHAVFQSVSAFCNAGFSTFSDSLIGFAERPSVLLPISALIIVGGLGYLSTFEVVRWWRHGGWRGRARLSTHTYAAVLVTAVLLGAGTLTYLALEWDGVLASMAFVDKLVNAWFMASSARTAGFNAVPYDLLGNDAAYLTILLMVIGGSPGSTAGGIKTTAMAILVAMAWSRIRGRRTVQLHDRSLPEETVGRALSLIVVFFVLVTTVNLLLSLSQASDADLAMARQTSLPLLFEAASAAGTVGLSMGMTPTLTTFSKVVIILTMFLGRVGPLVFFAAISIRSAAVPAGYRLAHEDLIVG
jgi:trk system potassium uptake protein TrkH